MEAPLYRIINMILDEVQASHSPYGQLLKILPRLSVIQKACALPSQRFSDLFLNSRLAYPTIFLTSPLQCLMGISNLIHPKLNSWSLLPPSQTCSFCSLPHLSKGLTSCQTKILESSLNPFFSLTSHIHSVVKSCQLQLRLYSDSNQFSTPSLRSLGPSYRCLLSGLLFCF